MPLLSPLSHSILLVQSLHLCFIQYSKSDIVSPLRLIHTKKRLALLN
nr:MAG TPA: hypothetical protein [Caudoviricetes sp.]